MTVLLPTWLAAYFGIGLSILALGVWLAPECARTLRPIRPAALIFCLIVSAALFWPAVLALVIRRRYGRG